MAWAASKTLFQDKKLSPIPCLLYVFIPDYLLFRSVCHPLFGVELKGQITPKTRVSILPIRDTPAGARPATARRAGAALGALRAPAAKRGGGRGAAPVAAAAPPPAGGNQGIIALFGLWL